MKAALYKTPGQPLVIEDLPRPEVGPGQVLVKVKRAGICGSDLHMTETDGILTPGSVLGHEFAGEVLELGAGVEGLGMGDRVTVFPITGCGDCPTCHAGDPRWCSGFEWHSGGFAEYAVVAAHNALKLPDSLSLVDGALIEPMAVSAHALLMAGDLKGRSVLVLGAGAIGLAAAFWARRFGAAHVAVSAPSRRREALARATGVEHFVLNGEQTVQELTTVFGGLPDVVVECVGLPGAFGRAMELARPRGTVLAVGACVEPDSFVPMVPLLKELKVLFSINYTQDDFRRAINAIDAGHVELRNMVTHTVGFKDFIETFESLRGASPHCKVMLDPQQ
jgi:(R,R)-butanediol dehydrogenase/meso-butanediol dehydrogenase/diacetyl reductase